MTFKELLAVVDERTKIKVNVELFGRNTEMIEVAFYWLERDLFMEYKVESIEIALGNLGERRLGDLQDHRCDFNDDVDVAFMVDDYEMGIITFDKILAVRLCEK